MHNKVGSERRKVWAGISTRGSHGLQVEGRRAGGEVARVWAVAGVRSPHDLTLTAAPLEVTGAGERTPGRLRRGDATRGLIPPQVHPAARRCTPLPRPPLSELASFR